MKSDEFTKQAGQPADLTTAYHEAVHAVMGYLLDIPFEYVTIEEKGEFLGHVRFQPDVTDYLDLQGFKNFHRNGFRPCGFGKKRDVLIKSSVKTYVELMMLISAAGFVAQFLFEGRGIDKLLVQWLGTSDQEEFADLGRPITGLEPEYISYCQYMMERTWNIMTVPAHEIVVEALANRLFIERTICYRDARAIIKSSFDELRGDILADYSIKIFKTREEV